MPNPSELQREEEGVFWKTGTVQEFLGLTDEEMVEVEKRRDIHKTCDENARLKENIAHFANLVSEKETIISSLVNTINHQQSELLRLSGVLEVYANEENYRLVDQLDTDNEYWSYNRWEFHYHPIPWKIAQDALKESHE